jgi:addiction module RelE/StbE family toxin
LARLSYSRQALNDLERLTDFLLAEEPAAAIKTSALIIEAVDILANHPLVGRLTEHDLRELVIARGHSGYLALYSYQPEQDVVLILAIRHQREVGYVSE